MSDLVHKFESNALFSSDLISLNDYLRDDEYLTLKSDAYWYIGLYKPFRKLYFESKAFNSGNGSLVIEYWDGTQYLPVPDLQDDTQNLSRNGFISWEFDDNSKITETWIQNTIDSIEKYWIRISFTTGIHSEIISSAGLLNSTTQINLSDEDVSKYTIGQQFYMSFEDSYHTVTSIDSTIGSAFIQFSPATTLDVPDNESLFSMASCRGMNIVFSDDNQLAGEIRTIQDYRFEEDSSFIAYQVSARDEIVQTLRNGGSSKIKDLNNIDFLPNSVYATKTIKRENITKWDILDVGEITQASKYLALSKIFFDVSENVDDKQYARYRDYEGMYGASFKTYYLSLDKDDDGNIDNSEKMAPNWVRIHKV